MAWMNWAASSSWGKTRERTWRVNILSRDFCSRQRQGLHLGVSQPSLHAAGKLHPKLQSGQLTPQPYRAAGPWRAKQPLSWPT